MKLNAGALGDDLPEDEERSREAALDPGLKPVSGSFCGQTAANLLARRMPRQWVGVTGGMKRKEPTGGVA